MEQTFIHEDFLLETEQAKELYHSYAADLPIIDYHNHLPPQEIAQNRQFPNLTQIWLSGDHYKWRAMRTCGVPERLITGEASDWEKFAAWAETVPKTLRNPLYHWTHLELKRPFGIADRLLDSTTASGIWEECNAKLATPAFSTQGILRQMNVEVVCTTDDPVDDLQYHSRIQKDERCSVAVYPAFRPDKSMAVEDPAAYRKYLLQLGEASSVEIRDFASLLEALRSRHDFFQTMGCRLSDHGLETIYADEYTEKEVNRSFDLLLKGKLPDLPDRLKLKSALLHELAVMDWEKGWTQQFHLGAMRNANSRMMRLLGPDTGFDSIGDFEIGGPLAKFLDRLENGEKLTKTILYNLNPRDNELIATMIGNFQDGSAPGKLQFGSAWWFLDQLDGMTKQLTALSNMGLLSQFIGMLTDSRSFLSFPRHEYFRRLLCNTLGGEMHAGLLPDEIALVGEIVRDICYFNAKRYFGFPARTGAGARES